MTLEIRTVTPQDEAAWYALWAQYLAFYDVTLPPEVTAQTWARCINPNAGFCARLAVLDGTPVGFALHHTHDSTWTLGPDCYLEDLFLTPETRGKGIGRALIDDLVAICKERGYPRLYWMTDAGNARARKLYDSYTPTDAHLRYRITF